MKRREGFPFENTGRKSARPKTFNTPHLVRVVREVDLVEYLRGLVLDGLHLDLVRRVLPLAVPQRLLQPLDRVHRDRVPPRPAPVSSFSRCSGRDHISRFMSPLERRQLLHERLRAREQPRGQPHQLPPALLAQPVPVVRQLLHDLAVDLVAEDLLKKSQAIRLLSINT